MADTRSPKTVKGVNDNVVIIKKVIEFLPLTLAKAEILFAGDKERDFLTVTQR